MNRLLTKAPEAVTIDGVSYEINTDWRDCLHTIDQLQDPSFLPEEKIRLLLYNMYLDDPPNQEEAIQKALWFLRCGEEPKSKDEPAHFDFSQDSKYIYAAFLKSSANLNNMHWWDFVSWLPELPESMFSRIVYLRSQKQRNKLTKEEKAEIRRIGEDVINIKAPFDEAIDAAIQEAFSG